MTRDGVQSTKVVPSTWENPTWPGVKDVTNDDLVQVPSSTWTRLIVTNDSTTDIAEADRLQREHVRLQRTQQQINVYYTVVMLPIWTIQVSNVTRKKLFPFTLKADMHWKAWDSLENANNTDATDADIEDAKFKHGVWKSI